MTTTAVKRFTVEQIFERAQELGIVLNAEGDSLLVTAASDVLTDKIRGVLAEYERVLIDHIYTRQVEEDMLREPALCGQCLDEEGIETPAIEDQDQDILLCERHTLRSWFL